MKILSWNIPFWVHWCHTLEILSSLNFSKCLQTLVSQLIQFIHHNISIFSFFHPSCLTVIFPGCRMHTPKLSLTSIVVELRSFFSEPGVKGSFNLSYLPHKKYKYKNVSAWRADVSVIYSSGYDLYCLYFKSLFFLPILLKVLYREWKTQLCDILLNLNLNLISVVIFQAQNINHCSKVKALSH